MARKVIYLSYIRLSDRVSRDWYINYLIEKRVEVEYWDITNAVRERIEERHSILTGYLRSFECLDELDARLATPENRDAVYVLLISYEVRLLPVFRLLAKYNCKTVRLVWGAMPVTRVSAERKLLKLLFTPSLLAKKVIGRIALMAAETLRLVNPTDVVFAAGRVCVSGQRFAVKVVPVNLVDYDHFVRVRSLVRFFQDVRYAVFLDTNLPYQSDLKFCGLSALSPSKYYASLNRFFSLLEAEYKIKIVIAAHPKSDYGPEVFEKRSIFRGVTPELVRDADFVISQTSTALSYAVLNLKPVVFVYTDEMSALYEKTVMKQLQDIASYLDSPLVNIDAIEGVTDIPLETCNRKRYESYKYSFLTSSESEYSTTQEIFFNELNAM